MELTDFVKVGRVMLTEGVIEGLEDGLCEDPTSTYVVGPLEHFQLPDGSRKHRHRVYKVDSGQDVSFGSKALAANAAEKVAHKIEERLGDVRVEHLVFRENNHAYQAIVRVAADQEQELRKVQRFLSLYGPFNRAELDNETFGRNLQQAYVEFPKLG